MLIHVPNGLCDLNDFGIRVPLLWDRYRDTLNSLMGTPTGVPASAWLIEKSLDPISREDVARVHNPKYVERLFAPDVWEVLAEAYELRSPHAPGRFDESSVKRPFTDLIKGMLVQCSGTLLTCETALSTGFAYFLGGGHHHAWTGGPRGFCIVNDIMIAIRKLQTDQKIKTAWVIDVDAHRGDGTAQIAYGDPSIQTLSIHMATGWPMSENAIDEGGRMLPYFLPSSVDIGVHSGREDGYVRQLEIGLEQLERMSPFARPDLAFVVSGSDPYSEDVLPSTAPLKLTKAQLLARDLLVFEFLKSRGIPQAYGMAGGYGPKNFEIHAQFLQAVLGK